MEITKIRLHLSGALERARGYFWQTRYKFKKLTGNAAERAGRLGHRLRARGNALRVLLAARSQKAIVAANRKITKTKAHVSMAFKRGTGPLRNAQNRLAGLKRSIAEKRQRLADERRARGNELRLLEAKPGEAIVEVERKITKVKTQPAIAPEQWTAHLWQMQNPLGLTRSIGEKLEKPPEEPRARKDELPVQAARSQEATVAADSKITKAKARFSTAFVHGTAHLRQAPKKLAGLGRNIVDKRQRRRQELSARESQMQELLASSPNAIAVIGRDHCFVTANQKALDLFGVSEKNLSQFNIDVFLVGGQIANLRRNGSFFMGRQERHGKCTIRRLDGSLRIAEFAFVTDVLPLLHLCRFYDLCMPQRPTPMHPRIQPGAQHFSDPGQAH